MVYFQANADSPVFPNLRGLLSKTAGLVDVLAGVLKPLAAKVRIAFVYGSIASGSEQSDSDIDLMLVGTLTPVELALPLRRARELLGREINPTVYTPAEFRKKQAAKFTASPSRSSSTPISSDFVVLDEYASMAPEAWTEVLRPALSDKLGRALFIGTPKGLNHFHDLYQNAQTQSDWQTFRYTTEQGGNVPAQELEVACGRLSVNQTRSGRLRV